MIYKTFIPAAQVTLGWEAVNSCGIPWGTNGVTFGGDNRSYRMPGARAPEGETDFRSFVMAYVNWGNPPWAQALFAMKSVATTKKYQNGKLIDQRTASANGIRFQEAYRSGAYAQLRVVHDVGNPFCSIGSIQYNTMTRFYRSGLIEMVGWRFQVPAHEAYARFNSTGWERWKPLFQRPSLDFACLFEPACKIDRINVSQSD